MTHFDLAISTKITNLLTQCGQNSFLKVLLLLFVWLFCLGGSTVTNCKRLFSASNQGVTCSGRNPLALELPREEKTFNSTEAKIYAS